MISDQTEKHRTDHITLGTYTRDGTQHTVIAARDPDKTWQLLNIAGGEATIIETLLPDEDEPEIRAIADMYLQEMRA